jgi:hypothetical protein
MQVPAERLRDYLGVTKVEYRQGRRELAITDTALSAV